MATFPQRVTAGPPQPSTTSKRPAALGPCSRPAALSSSDPDPSLKGLTLTGSSVIPRVASLPTALPFHLRDTHHPIREEAQALRHPIYRLLQLQSTPTHIRLDLLRQVHNSHGGVIVASNCHFGSLTFVDSSISRYPAWRCSSSLTALILSLSSFSCSVSDWRMEAWATSCPCSS